MGESRFTDFWSRKSYAILTTMNDQPLDAEFAQNAVRWQAWLQKHGLEGLADALLGASEPLAPIGAQLLYVAQPALSLIAPREAIGRWARLLETPGGLAWLREQLIPGDALTMRAEDSDGE
ncbi:MAG: hypothetical protein BroJett018_43570 [Chloroflexota bacterium]|nr:MAG: hypothetical protein BroJett018_43570 [Chloroflexota bacterium]